VFLKRRAWGQVPQLVYAQLLHADPKSANIQSSHQYLCALLGPTFIKALCKMLMKLTPGVDKHLSKSFAVQYHQHSFHFEIVPNFAKFVPHLPNTLWQKKLLILLKREKVQRNCW